ncbi:MAG: 4'-phosphopantetheinyl transferase superfamily protein [Bacteroidota bacterium]
MRKIFDPRYSSWTIVRKKQGYIGNDIVDLQAAGPEQRHRNPRWMDKVFSPEEQSHILAAEQPEQQLWALWAAKESAYKVFLKQEQQRQFRPKAIQVQPSEDRYDYRATYNNQQVNIQLSASRFYVHCLASNTDSYEQQINILRLPECSQEEGRIKLQNRLFDGLRYRGWPAPLEVQKCELGIPWLKGWEDYCDLSFSHHGDYYAYVITFASPKDAKF